MRIASREQVQTVLSFMAGSAVRADAQFKIRPATADPDDDFALELAFAARADYLVTYNRRDFDQGASSYGVKVVSPAEFLRRMETT